MGHRVSKQQQQHNNNSSNSNHNNKKEKRQSIGRRKLIGNLIYPNSNSNNSSKKRKSSSLQCKQEKSGVNVLVLGASGSGKTTLINQIRLMSSDNISKEERLEYRTVILFNIIEAMQSILSAMNKYDVPIDCVHRKAVAEKLLQEVNPFPTTLDIFRSIRSLWKEEGNIQLLYDTRHEYQLSTINDTAEYYFEHTLEHVSSSKEALINYLPTDQEILRANRKTTSIVEHSNISFKQVTEGSDAGSNITTYDYSYYNILDVGGLRSYRKQWAEAFAYKSLFSTLLFMVSLSEYDQCLLEDSTTNRMQESLLLFESICDLQYFKKSSIILFLNKTDVFKEKLSSSPLYVYFPHYKGGDHYENACQFILGQYKKITVKSPNKKIYTHFICALDTVDVQLVMSALHEDIIQISLDQTTLL
ncbi:guanine nucleotide binding protein, alpha subunit [Mycotypha africana]|uniref:guanine nucleotide binding protein, alpha subunit n=1 Tax=Mycotypha africana TaxID=64632 RepID=UPI0023016549|nr:guanine nucleotide binding protein, alpha subunit [Mycotypha africana]KAI8967421.1 guanine nucleotide binding protein, alpha subunit [Mycotypha africana]